MLNIFRKKKKVSGDSFDLIRDLVYRTLGDDSSSIVLTRDTKLLDIGFDSIKYTNLLLNLEDIVDTDIETLALELDLASLQRISDIMTLVDKLRKNKDEEHTV